MVLVVLVQQGAIELLYLNGIGMLNWGADMGLMDLIVLVLRRPGIMLFVEIGSAT
jgi:hypothetical protein